MIPVTQREESLMPTETVIKLVDTLDDALEDSSIPELVSALIWLCRRYRGHIENQGWLCWEKALEEAFLKVEDQYEYEELVAE